MKKFFFLLLLAVLLGVTLLASAADITLSYDTPIRCGQTTTFTVGIEGDDMNPANCKYYLNFIRLGYTEKDALTGKAVQKSTMVMDCSRNAYPYNYRTDPSFDFEFCASGTYYLKFYVMDLTASPYTIISRTFSVIVDDENYPTIDAIADEVVARLSAQYTDKWELAVALHDWLISNTSYDYSLLYCHPEGVLARGKGTCESYQRAYAMLLGRAGIENTRAEGTSHTWNLVKLDGSWYHVDPTWDDSDDIHFYFGMTDEMMSLSQGHAGYTAPDGIICTATDDNWYIHTGKVTQWSDRYVSSVQAQLDQRLETFSIDAGQIQDSTYDDKIRRMLSTAWLDRQSWTAGGKPVTLSLTYAADTNTISGTAAYQPEDTLNLPASLTEVDASAFANTAAEAISIPAGLQDEASLANLPTDKLWICPAGSAAAAYAEAHGISYRTVTK